MKKFFILIFIYLLLTGQKMSETKIKLPQPVLKGKISIEETLLKRRSIRKFRKGVISLNQVSQILWAAYGITDNRGFKTVPSAGATFPLIIYVLISNVSNLEAGIYKYQPDDHSLIKIVKGDKSDELMLACLFQKFVKEAQINILIAADFKRTTSYYGERGVMYVHMEAGHCGQNIYLQAEALKLGTVAVGAFDDEKVAKIFKLEKNIKPLYIFPVGLKF